MPTICGYSQQWGPATRAWLPGAVCGLLSSGWLPALPPWPAGLVLVLAGAWLSAGQRAAARFGGGLALGALLGIAHGAELLAQRLPEACVRLPVTVSGTVASLPRVTHIGPDTRQQRFELAVSALAPARCRGPRRLLLTYYGPHTLQPGEQWQFEARLKRPWGLVNPGSFNMQAWFAQTSIDATGSARAAGTRRLEASTSLRALPDRLRARLSDRLEALPLSAGARAILQAVTVADRSGLDTGLWRLFQHFGINHLLVISGLHIGLVAALGYALGRPLAAGLLLLGDRGGIARLLPGGVALILAAAYTALAGFSLATVRALAMLGCVIVASACWRQAGSWRNLLLAAALLLACNPLAGLGSGFWLSFGAVACLLWLGLWSARPDRWRHRLAVHGYMSVAMLPLGGWWFGGFSQVAALANLLLVPLLGLYVIPLALLGAACALLGLPLADALWRWAAIPLETLLPLGEAWAAAHPGWLYRHLAPGPLEALLAVAGVALWVVPAPGRVKLLLPLLLLPLLLPPREPRTAAPEAVHVVVMDVGQGTAVLVYDRQRALLYDTGGGVPGGHTVARSVVLPLLRERGIKRLQTLVVSHGDSDHSAGLQDILQSLPVGRVLVGADLAGGDFRACRAGRARAWPGDRLRMRFLSPAAEGALSRNNGSCVLWLEVYGHRLLLPGDIDADRERLLVHYWRDALASDWLLAAHHGSGSSSSHAWLRTVDPQHVMLSHGYANRFGHPHPDVLARVAAGGARAWSTARQGALELVFLPGGELRVISHRALARGYWL